MFRCNLSPALWAAVNCTWVNSDRDQLAYKEVGIVQHVETKYKPFSNIASKDSGPSVCCDVLSSKRDSRHVVLVEFSSLAKIFRRMFDHSFPACACFVVVVVLFCILKRTLARAH